jgi:pyruvate dehydrogenase E1 component alpha subunit
MVRIRRFEERSLRAYQAKKIGGFLHLYIGQEAVAVGCCSLMGKHDHVITAYRTTATPSRSEWSLTPDG